jgi:hypothetical protein
LDGHVINRDRCGLVIDADQCLRIRHGQQREKNSCEEDKQSRENARIQESGFSNTSLLHLWKYSEGSILHEPSFRVTRFISFLPLILDGEMERWTFKLERLFQVMGFEFLAVITDFYLICGRARLPAGNTLK